MKVCIEGVDGSGKSTLAKLLCEKYGMDYIHCTSADPNDYDNYYQLMRKANLCCDRLHLGEMVWPVIFDRPGHLTWDQFYDLNSKAKEEGVRILVCTADIDELKRRLKARGNELDVTLNNLARIDSMFKDLAGRAGIPVVDTSKMSFEELCERYID